jgi:hypothetical protein
MYAIPCASITRSRRGFLDDADGVPGFGDRDSVGRGLSGFIVAFFSGLEAVGDVFHGSFLPMVVSSLLVRLCNEAALW